MASSGAAFFVVFAKARSPLGSLAVVAARGSEFNAGKRGRRREVPAGRSEAARAAGAPGQRLHSMAMRSAQVAPRHTPPAAAGTAPVISPRSTLR